MHNLANLLDGVGRPRLLVLGDLILDRYTFGNAERVSPEAPVIVLRVDAREARLGGAASVALLLRGLGAEVTLAGVVGEDSEGRTLRSLLRDENIDSHLVLVDPERPTTTKERIIGRAANRHSHQIVRVDHEARDPINAAVEDGLVGGLLRLLRSRPETGSPHTPDRLSATGDGNTSCDESTVAQPAQDTLWAGPPALVENRSTNSHGQAPVMVFPGFDAILIADYAKGVCNPTLLRRVLEAARDCRLPVIVDPASMADYTRYAGASLLKPNRTEAELATGIRIVTPADALEAGQRLCREYQLGATVITLDCDGMALIQSDGSTELLGCEGRKVYDITGAGDMVLAALGLCIASDLSIPDAVCIANIAAGLEVECLGVAPVTRAELRVALAKRPMPRGPVPILPVATALPPPASATTNDHRTIDTPELHASVLPRRNSHSENPISKSSSKLTTLPELIRLADHYRHAGKTIVFTNGCFDLLHVGHVACIADAAALGDVLIVAVNSDASVWRLKGAGRPVIDERDRAAMLAALASVDHLVIFDDATPHKLLEAIRPDVLVKGGATPEIIGHEVVEAYGGRVVRVAEVPGVSTTTIVSQIHAVDPPLAAHGSMAVSARSAAECNAPSG